MKKKIILLLCALPWFAFAQTYAEYCKEAVRAYKEKNFSLASPTPALISF